MYIKVHKQEYMYLVYVFAPNPRLHYNTMFSPTTCKEKESLNKIRCQWNGPDVRPNSIQEVHLSSREANTRVQAIFGCGKRARACQSPSTLMHFPSIKRATTVYSSHCCLCIYSFTLYSSVHSRWPVPSHSLSPARRRFANEVTDHW